jgi:endonuclease/exonuclease/phosphatase family metal-dependent hydrolase
VAAGQVDPVVARCEAESASVPRLRLLSYNIRALRDDGAAVARVIRAADPHVVCIQEAPRFLRWRSICAALARRSGLVIVGGGRPAAGNLLMSTLGVEVHGVRDQLFTKDLRLHQRGTALALFSLHRSRFVVGGTHLDLEDAPRIRHVEELHRAVDSFAAGVPSIVAGDINDLPDSLSWQKLAEARSDAFGAVGVGDGFTYSATEPVRRIDGVFADRRLQVLSATVLDSPDVRLASDHRPLLVELDLA